MMAKAKAKPAISEEDEKAVTRMFNHVWNMIAPDAEPLCKTVADVRGFLLDYMSFYGKDKPEYEIAKGLDEKTLKSIANKVARGIV